MILDPTLAKDVLVKYFKNFENNSFSYTVCIEPLKWRKIDNFSSRRVFEGAQAEWSALRSKSFLHAWWWMEI